MRWCPPWGWGFDGCCFGGLKRLEERGWPGGTTKAVYRRYLPLPPSLQSTRTLPHPRSQGDPPPHKTQPREPPTSPPPPPPAPHPPSPPPPPPTPHLYRLMLLLVPPVGAAAELLRRAAPLLAELAHPAAVADLVGPCGIFVVQADGGWGWGLRLGVGGERGRGWEGEREREGLCVIDVYAEVMHVMGHACGQQARTTH